MQIIGSCTHSDGGKLFPFLDEVCAYQTTLCLFKALDHFANEISNEILLQSKSNLSAKRQKNEIGNKCVKFSLNHNLSEKEASAAFKSWAADELHSYGFHT